MTYEPVIGLEIHIQLNTESKLFSASRAKFGGLPNIDASHIDLAFPGTLPVLNKEAVRQALMFGLAINAKINPFCIFARKNYFYPDLPKSYQISQSNYPIVSEGSLSYEIEGHVKEALITRAHLEEDAGKSIHDLIPQKTALDFNRAGAPLLEIVTAPIFYNSKDAVAFLKMLHRLVTHLNICDGNMQEGSFRVDVNISLKPVGSDILGTRCEIKNVNSFRFIEKAIAYEIERQSEILSSGGKVLQQTRLFNESTGQTVALRNKENAHDYRYFNCPDLLPVHISQEMIETIRKQLPPLPSEIIKRLEEQYELSSAEALFLFEQPAIMAFFEKSCAALFKARPKNISNILLSEVMGYCRKEDRSFESLGLNPADIAVMAERLVDKTLSSKTAKQLLSLLLQGQSGVDLLIEQHGLKQLQDLSYLKKVVAEVIAEFPSQYQEYRQGKDKLLAFFVGQIMKRTAGKASPDQIPELLSSDE
jgi:aspartyl-tRNA(Asn)/glutamyl-tRNA(Gln) amidotransferase subunit B